MIHLEAVGFGRERRIAGAGNWNILTRRNHTEGLIQRDREARTSRHNSHPIVMISSLILFGTIVCSGVRGVSGESSIRPLVV